LKFSPTNFVLRKIKERENSISSRSLKVLDQLKIPIIGYYKWEMVAKKILEKK
jgi:hypothetical protein